MRIKYINRYELKYILPLWKQAEIRQDLEDHLEPDMYGDGLGHYPVTSLYYDTADYKAYWDKLEGHRFRRKVRIRVYNHQIVLPDTGCFLEIKQRNDKTLQKKRAWLPYQMAQDLCSAGVAELAALETRADFSKSEQATVAEAHYLAQILQLQPACIVRYDRSAFNGDAYDVGLRITFDTNLRFRTHALSLLTEGAAEDSFFLSPDWGIMEVKINNRVPYWLSEVLSKHQCAIRRISKYCTALERAEIITQRRHILN